MEFSPVTVGTMRLGAWGAQLNTAQWQQFIEECLALDLRDFDHADIYGHYTTEADFGAVLKQQPALRQQMQLITKCGIKSIAENRPGHLIKSYDSSQAHIVASVENSLRELGTDYLDLLLLHRPDYLLDPQEVADTFAQLRQSGKVRAFGVSNFTASQFETLQAYTPLITNQLQISLLHLDAFDDGTLDQCLRHNIQPMAWSPVGGTAFFGQPDASRNARIRTAATLIGEKHGIGIDQVLLAFLAKHPAGIIPVMGTTKIARLAAAKAAMAIRLSHEDWYRLFQASTGEKVP